MLRMIWTPENSILRNPIRFGKRHDGKERVAASIRNFGWLSNARKKRRAISDNRIRSELRALGVPLCASCGHVRSGAERLLPLRLLSPAALAFAGHPCRCRPDGIDCTPCDAGTVPSELELEIPSNTWTANTLYNCNCDAMDGIVICAQVDHAVCQWSYDFDITADPNCSSRGANVTLSHAVTPAYAPSFTGTRAWFSFPTGDKTRFHADQTLPLDCQEWPSTHDWFDSDTVFASCFSVSGKTVTVTVL